MACLTILEYPDPRLRTRARPVRAFDAGLARLIDDMFETMYAMRGIGLAATQVNVHQQVITLDVSGEATAPLVFINPEILSGAGIGLVQESCLSLPGVSATVRRATRLRVRALDRNGSPAVRELDGLLAVSLQHEIDHLRGRLFVDRLPFFERRRLRRALAAATLAASRHVAPALDWKSLPHRRPGLHAAINTESPHALREVTR